MISENAGIYEELKDSDLAEPHSLVKEDAEDYFGTRRRVIMAWQLRLVYYAGQLGLLLGLTDKTVYG